MSRNTLRLLFTVQSASLLQFIISNKIIIHNLSSNYFLRRENSFGINICVFLHCFLCISLFSGINICALCCFFGTKYLCFVLLFWGVNICVFCLFSGINICVLCYLSLGDYLCFFGVFLAWLCVVFWDKQLCFVWFISGKHYVFDCWFLEYIPVFCVYFTIHIWAL